MRRRDAGRRARGSGRPVPPSHELRALRAFLAAILTDEPAESVAAAAHTVPAGLVRLHLLSPLAYRAGDGRFRKDYIASSLAAELRRALLEECAGALAQVGVPVAPIKGIAYAGTLYEDPAERPMTDMDLLIPPDAHQEACKALESIGFRRAPVRVQRSPLHHAVAFKRGAAAVDLHRTIVQPHRSRIDLEAVWQRSSAAVDIGPTGRRLDPYDLTLFHLIHMARHELRVTCIGYVDAHRLLATLDCPVLLDRAREWRLSRAVGAALAMTDALAGEPASLSRVLPSVDEVLRDELPGRLLQVVRKVSLLEGPAELLGLARVYLAERLLGP